MSLQAQTSVFIQNPSFEDGATKVGTLDSYITGWYNCGSYGETGPDVHSHETTYFRMQRHAAHGEQYLGMVARDNNTQEGVGTKLHKPLVRNGYYHLTVKLARSDTYISRSRMTHLTVNYDIPLLLEVFGSDRKCRNKILLAKSVPVTNTDWQEYSFALKPDRRCKFLTFRVYYHPMAPEPVNGNMLLDDIRIVRMPDEASLDKEHRRYGLISGTESDWQRYLEIQKMIREAVVEVADHSDSTKKQLLAQKFSALFGLTYLAEFNEYLTDNRLPDFLPLLSEGERIWVLQGLEMIGAQKAASRWPTLFTSDLEADANPEAVPDENQKEFRNFEHICLETNVSGKTFHYIIHHQDELLDELIVLQGALKRD